MGAIVGAPAATDEVVVANIDRIDTNLADLVDRAPADQRYSYVIDGTAQQLDHIVASSTLLARVAGYAVARNDADFPDILRNDASRPERLSDHDMPVAYFTFPTADLSVDESGTPTPVSRRGHLRSG